MIGVSSRRRPFLWRAAAVVATLSLSSTGQAPVSAASAALPAAEVRGVISQAAAEAQAAGLPSVIAVTDDQGVVIGLFRMAGAPANGTVIGVPGHGLEGKVFPVELLAATKAATGALLSSGGNAFSTRTASFLVHDHTPPPAGLTPGGPPFRAHVPGPPLPD